MDSFVVAPVSPKKWGASLRLDSCKDLTEDASPDCSPSGFSELSTLASSDSEALSACSEGEWEETELQQTSQLPEAKMVVAEEVAVPVPPQAQTKRTQLRSKASLFVPCTPNTIPAIVPAAQPMPVSCTDHDDDLVPGIIRQAFGAFLKNLTVSETPLSTSVRVELKDVPRYAPESEINEQLARSKSMQCLLMALTAALGPKLFGLAPSADESRLSFEYFKMGTGHLCWEFLNRCCARGAHCRWEHAVAQVFIVALILPPPTDPDQPESSQLLHQGPVVSSSSDDAIVGNLLADSAASSAPIPPDALPCEEGLSSPVGSGLRTSPGRIAWADLEDSDDDLE